jgi:predicted house-cleaning noncanonical NTP pyrophosphatase (MazG superfamily)
MKSFLLNKLLRDKVFIDMKRIGQQVTYHKLTDEEFVSELSRKLLEEAKEFKVSNGKKALDELVDVLEVVEALAVALGEDFEALRTRQAARKANRGGFAERMYVERIDLDDDDPWVDYYSKDSEKFPQI